MRKKDAFDCAGTRAQVFWLSLDWQWKDLGSNSSVVVSVFFPHKDFKFLKIINYFNDRQSKDLGSNHSAVESVFLSTERFQILKLLIIYGKSWIEILTFKAMGYAGFKTIFHSPWKSSYRTVIADNTLVLYFRIKKVSEFLL